MWLAYGAGALATLSALGAVFLGQFGRAKQSGLALLAAVAVGLAFEAIAEFFEWLDRQLDAANATGRAEMARLRAVHCAKCGGFCPYETDYEQPWHGPTLCQSCVAWRHEITATPR